MEVLRKVLSEIVDDMTAGIDKSALFPYMVKVSIILSKQFKFNSRQRMLHITINDTL